MNGAHGTRVLVLIDWYLPGYKAGGPIQSLANLVENLKNEFSFSIVTRNTDYLESSPYPNLLSDEWIDQDNLKLHYVSARELNYSNIRDLLLNRAHDVVYINSMFSYYFALLPLWILRGRGTNIILAPRGMLAKSALGIKPLRKRLFLFISSALGLFKDIRFQATSEQEVKDIQAVFGPGSSIKFALNIPASIPDLSSEMCEKEVGCVNLVNVARISPEKNLWYALNVLTQVKGKVQFDIYGSIYNEQYWKSCKELIEAMPENITIIVHQGVNRSELFPLLQRSHFLFLPTKGENFGHIIMESLSCGCPVIISDQTPWRELEMNNIGYDISLASEVKFIDAIETIIEMSQDEYDQKSVLAIDFAKAYVANSNSIKQSKELFLP